LHPFRARESSLADQGVNQHRIEVFDQSITEGSQAWRARIEHALEGGGFALFAQDAFALPGKMPAHSEVTVRMLTEQGEPVPAAQVLPMARATDCSGVSTAWWSKNCSPTCPGVAMPCP